MCVRVCVPAVACLLSACHFVGNAMPSVTHMDSQGNTALHYCCQGKGSGMLAQVTPLPHPPPLTIIPPPLPPLTCKVSRRFCSSAGVP